ncbi:dynein regulatory complex subunit 7 isoform X2 [Nelusetta ayraudi]|uniref:dynein regulatory complex subunit 7 isoform X2 n=1 Tax=Nelusetta ayraudi TaxID=303726 RepID=UPI003F6F8015
MDFLEGIDDDELLQTLLEEEESTPRDRLASLNLDLDALCPESYRVNTPDEERLLVFATELQRQYSHLYPERTPLLLCPTNEYGVKFVSTCLKPTPPESSQLYTWQGCSSFVANFMSLEPLDPPTEPPQQQFSSTLVLRCQRATSLEFAALLCSLLLGANYDAYVVSGYTDREMCERDLRLKECPLLDAEKRSINAKVKTEFNKYMVKQKRELKSRFVTQQEKKKGSSRLRLLKSKSGQEESRRRDQDPLHGRRVHFWVLVLAGSRSIDEHFFIDPLSGKSYSSDNDHFLGVESVWNNLNYYINMQDCSYGCDEMQFHLEDLEMWEPVLFGATSKKQLIDAVAKRKAGQEVEESIFKQEEGLCPRMFQMPRSWVDDIHITKKDLESRWPGGQNVILYRRVRLEEFAPYLRPDGLVKRLTTYQDVDLTEVHVVKEWFQYRNDKLEQREVDHLDKVTVERFSNGRRFHLQLHRFTNSERVTEFSSARLDYLVQRVERPGEMTEIFDGRCDRLYRRHVTFEQQAEEGGKQDEKKKEEEEEEDYDDGRTEMKIPQKVVEQFHRDPSRPASEDVAELVFQLGERRIEVTYHVEDFRFIPSRRQFLKPQTSSETQRAEDFTADMVSNFQLDLCVKPLKTLTLYEMMLSLMKEEEESIQQIRTSLREVRDIVACREREDRDVQLVASPWLTEGAIRARNQREEMERLAVEEQLWLEEKEADILTPLLIRRDQSQPLSSLDAQQLHQDCLDEFKLRQAAHANLIQERYAMEVKELHEKHEWYRDHQLHMTKEEKAEYQIFCSEKMMKIQVAKKRLNMHKETAAQKFQALDERLANG